MAAKSDTSEVEWLPVLYAMLCREPTSSRSKDMARNEATESKNPLLEAWLDEYASIYAEYLSQLREAGVGLSLIHI